MIPKDYEDPLCSSGRRCWVTAYLFGKTGVEVKTKMDKYFGRWPTEGYNTFTMALPHEQQSNEGVHWRSIMRRFSTCD